MNARSVPVKYYKDEGFVERKIELDDEDLDQIIEEYLRRHAEFDFDEIEIVNNRPMNIWLYAKCRKYIDPDAPEQDQITDALKGGSGSAPISRVPSRYPDLKWTS
jgi:hypothetical protein